MALFLRKEKAGSPVTAILLGNIIVALAGAPFMFTTPLGEGDGWWLLLLGVVQLGLPYVLYSIAIKHVTALEATLIPLIEPVLNPLWVMLALGERPGPWAIVGALLVLGAVLARGAMMIRGRARGGCTGAADLSRRWQARWRFDRANDDKRFRELHRSGCFAIPNPWDIGSARYLQHLGFKALATSSAGFAFSRGLPDNGVPRDMMLAHIRELVEATALPVNADFENGLRRRAGGRGGKRAALRRDGRGGSLDRGFDERRGAVALRSRACGRSVSERRAKRSATAA